MIYSILREVFCDV